MKLVVATRRAHPVQFAPYMTAFLTNACNYLLEYKPNPVKEKMDVLVVMLLRDTLQDETFKSAARDEDHQNARHLFEVFFTPEASVQLIECIVKRVFVLTADELQTWDDDPESFVKEEEAARFTSDRVRPVCESIFRGLLELHTEELAHYILQMTQALSMEASNTLVRDACYRAVGRAYYELEGLVNLGQWFHTELGPILSHPESTQMGLEERIIKARAAWLLGEFAGQASPQVRPLVYQTLVPLLDSSKHDLVLAFTSSHSLNYYIDEYGRLRGELLWLRATFWSDSAWMRMCVLLRVLVFSQSLSPRSFFRLSKPRSSLSSS
mmetsp:Transcript_13673/g.34843  ORF Transcript_13673/g.34843 Transcript_13673/m.34843 type:complete len:324 (-) Transcript_13673:408-1379(-)